VPHKAGRIDTCTAAGQSSPPVPHPVQGFASEAGERLALFLRNEVSKDARQVIQPGTALISSGLVDSFSLIKVLAFIEDEFGVVIPDEAATAKAMDSIELILQLMETYGGRRDG
jgi:acyl carrier protein